MMSSQGCEEGNEAVAGNTWEAETYECGKTRTTSVFEAADSTVGNKAPGMNAPRAAASKAQQGTSANSPPTPRSAKRGLSCHHHAAMTVRSMRSGILPPIRCPLTVPLQHPPFRQTLELLTAQRLPATL